MPIHVHTCTGVLKGFHNDLWYKLQVLFTLGSIYSSLKLLNTQPLPLNIITLYLQMCTFLLYISPDTWCNFNTTFVLLSILGNSILCNWQYHIILPYVPYFLTKQPNTTVTIIYACWSPNIIDLFMILWLIFVSIYTVWYIF